MTQLGIVPSWTDGGRVLCPVREARPQAEITLAGGPRPCFRKAELGSVKACKFGVPSREVAVESARTCASTRVHSSHYGGGEFAHEVDKGVHAITARSLAR